MSAYGYVMLGCKIDNKKLDLAIKKIHEDSKKVERGCSHEFTKGWKFCPECGARAETYTQDELLSKIEFLEKIGFSSHYKDGNIRSTTNENTFFVTVDKKYIGETEDIDGSGSCDSIKIPSALEVNDIRFKLEQMLNPYGLWDVNDFKIWVLGCYC